MNVKSILTTACMLVAGASVAGTSPVMVSLFTPVQAPGSSYDVGGFRLSLIYGECHDFTGLDIGLVSHSSGDFTGLAIGGINVSDEQFYGLQLGVANVNPHHASGWRDHSVGVQFGLINHSRDFCGLQDGVVNASSGTITGLQAGLANFATDLRGAQCGYFCLIGVNFATSVHGCQLGLVNYTTTMESGLQIGLLNVIANNGWLPVLPVVNGHF